MLKICRIPHSVDFPADKPELVQEACHSMLDVMRMEGFCPADFYIELRAIPNNPEEAIKHYGAAQSIVEEVETILLMPPNLMTERIV